MNRFQSWYSIQPVALRALLTINVVLYVLWQVVFIHIDVVAAFVFNHLALNPGLPGILYEPWQLITYNFLHLQPGFWGLIHVGFNMLWLYWIGKEYEELHGPHRLLAAYLLGGLGGGLLTVLLHALLPGVGAFGGVVFGASAAVLGVITTVAILFPYKSIGLLFIGTVRLIYVVLGFLALDLLFLAAGGTSVSAHLGGALFGFLLANAEQRDIDLSSWARIFFRGAGRSRRTARKPRGSWMDRLGGLVPSRRKQATPAPARPVRRAAPDEAPEPRQESEVDRILDKISDKGYDALTEEEKRILYEASRR